LYGFLLAINAVEKIKAACGNAQPITLPKKNKNGHGQLLGRAYGRLTHLYNRPVRAYFNKSSWGYANKKIFFLRFNMPSLLPWTV